MFIHLCHSEVHVVNDSFSFSMTARVCRRSTPLCHFVELHWVQTRKRFRICLLTAWLVCLNTPPPSTLHYNAHLRQYSLRFGRQNVTHVTSWFSWSILILIIEGWFSFFWEKMWKLKNMKGIRLVCVDAAGLSVSFIVPLRVEWASRHPFSFCFNVWLLVSPLCTSQASLIPLLSSSAQRVP